jgi:hypothetical protein
MSTFVHFRDEKVDLKAASRGLLADLWAMYENRRRYRGANRMPLVCTQSHAGQMYLKVVDGELWAAHYPGQGDGECSVRIGPESDSHRHIKDYAARALEAGGYTVQPEFSTGYKITRLDLAVQAPNRFGVEAQVTPLAAKDAKSRTTKSFKAGWPALWIPGTETIGNTLAGAVPVLRYNERQIDWEPGVPAKGTATALGLRHVTREKCTAYSRWKVCPETGRGNYCDRWHPWLDDVIPGWTVDDALVGLAGGVLSLLQTGTGRVHLVATEDVPTYVELTGHDGAFTPGGHSSAPTLQEGPDRECAAVRRHEELRHEPAAVDWFKAPQRPPLKFHFPEPTWARCQQCGRDICHPESLAAGLCQRHLLIQRSALQRMKVTA